MARTLFIVMLLLSWLGLPGAGDAQARARLDLFRRRNQPRITRFRRVRRFGWHSGSHYGPYTDSRGRRRVGWHSGTHKDGYTIDVSVLDKVDENKWDVFVKLGKHKTPLLRRDVTQVVRHSLAVTAQPGTRLTWISPQGTVLGAGGTRPRRRFVGNGWRGVDLGNSVIRVDVPGAPDVQVFARQKTKDLAPDKKTDPPEDRAKQQKLERTRRKRDKLLDQADDRFGLGLYPQAALLYQKAMKLETEDPIARFAVAHSLFALGVYGTAGKNLRVALDRFPDWGLVDLKLPGFYKNEATFFNKLVKLKKYVLRHPKDRDARLLLGYCHYFSGNRDAGLDQFRKLAGVPGGDKHAELFLGVERRPPPVTEPRND